MPTTPSPPPHPHTPQAPRYGYGDSWEPYSPRKSARLSAQQLPAARTPSPQNKKANQQFDNPNTLLRSPRSAKRRGRAENLVSPTPSPKKKRMPPVDPTRRSSGYLTAEGTMKAAASLDLHGKTESRSARTNISTQAGMLPTPAKTPNRKHPSAQNDANIAAIARNLFHSDEVEMPDPKKKRTKKYSGLSMDSFTALEDEEPIKIFTDSHDRVPEIDNSTDNPFYGDGAIAPPKPSKRRSKRQQVSIPGEGKKAVDDVSRRDDGLIYVFRGKKIFKKFEDEGTMEDSEDSNTAEGASKRHKRLTRSSIKPRLLFPPKDSHSKDRVDEDEEAETDIEGDTTKQDEHQPETPADLVDRLPSTPNAPKFAPNSPPTTVRATRADKKDSEASMPIKAGRDSKRSPFDWRHVKASSESSQNGSSHKGGARKRSASEELDNVVHAAKRTRA